VYEIRLGQIFYHCNLFVIATGGIGCCLFARRGCFLVLLIVIVGRVTIVIAVAIAVTIAIIATAITDSQYFVPNGTPFFFVFIVLLIERKDIELFFLLDVFVVQGGVKGDLIVPFHQIQVLVKRRKVLEAVLSGLEEFLHPQFDPLVKVSLVHEGSHPFRTGSYPRRTGVQQGLPRHL